MSNLTKVVAGGQSGVDQAALRAARDCGLELGGWCPPGCKGEVAVISAEFGLKETPNDRSPDAPDVLRSQRTEWNVRDSDGTLVIVRGEPRDPGTEWTIECAKRFERPLLVCQIDDHEAASKITQWLSSKAIRVLNVAGPSESTSPGIGDAAEMLLQRVCNQ